MKILVSGATGYVGRHLVRRLTDEGHDVSVISRNRIKAQKILGNLEIFEIDITNEETDFSFINEFNVFYHCAGEIKNASNMYKLHVKSTNNMLKQIKQGKVRWVQLSSVGVYGPQKSGNITEETAFNPIGEYEETKAKAEILVSEYCKKNGNDYVILRPSNIFSIDMTNTSLINLIKVIKLGLFFYMNRSKDAYSTYIHIDDVVEALTLVGLSTESANQDFIVSDGMPQIELVKTVCRNSQSAEPKLYIPETAIRALATIIEIIPKAPAITPKINALTTKATYSSKKIETLLSFERKKGIMNGLIEMINK